MEGIFIGVLCLSGSLTFSTCLLHQYHFVSDAMNWTEAQSYCREKYTDLATIENTEEMKKLQDTVSAAGHSSEVWIGLYSHIDWKWSDGFNQSGAEYRKWSEGAPNYKNANQLCVRMKIQENWHDVNCNLEIPFVCYRGTLEDPDFVLVSTKKDWTEAQRHCREHYTDLATQSRCNHNPWSATIRTTIHHPDQTPLQTSVIVHHRPPGPTAVLVHRPYPMPTRHRIRHQHHDQPHDTESATLDPPPRPLVRDPQTAIHGVATEALDLRVIKQRDSGEGG
ncbi:unnamed protein product [Pleuronectes platessa]|uniref:C-type lectin domain-containing protein n=1 Tax=Pleuronectes platessa TaxID=8262 RepID=A0A9N7TKS9_PLEPL|nr:unnamed protein product [Pleuronectes platessa]